MTKTNQETFSFTLSVKIPQSNALESVNNKASTRREAILRQASYNVVLSGTVRALHNLNLFTVLSPLLSPLKLLQQHASNNTWKVFKYLKRNQIEKVVLRMMFYIEEREDVRDLRGRRSPLSLFSEAFFLPWNEWPEKDKLFLDEPAISIAWIYPISLSSE